MRRMQYQIPIDLERIGAFCHKWEIRQMALFGSVLRDDFRPDSDVDVLIVFGPEIPWSLYDWMDMQEELKQILGRDVDLVSKDGLRNPIRRGEILDTCEVIYEAA